MSDPGQDNLVEDISLEVLEDIDDIDFSSLVDLPDFPTDLHITHNADASPPEKYLVFQIDEKQYGVLSRDVHEVASALPVTPLPNVPEWLAGLSNLRGEIITIVDTRKLWKLKTLPPQRTKFLVFRRRQQDTPVAFVVDKLNELVSLSERDINFSAADFGDSFPTFFGKVEYKSNPIFLLEAKSLLSSLTLVEVSV